MRKYFPQVLGLAVIVAIGLGLYCCGGGSDPGSPPPPPPPSNAIQVTVSPTQTAQTWDSWTVIPEGPFIRVGADPNVQINATMLSNIITDMVDAGVTGFRIEQHWAQLAWTVDYPNSDTTINWAFIDFSKPYSVGAKDPTFDLVAQGNQVIIPTLNRLAGAGITSRSYVDPIYPVAKMPAFLTATPAKYGTFALAFVQWLAGNTPQTHPAQTIKVDRYVVENEPDGTGWPTSTIHDLYSAMQARFAGAGVATKLQVAETASCNTGYYNTVSSGLTNIDVISFHSFDYQPPPKPASFVCRNALRTSANAIGATTAMTEYGSNSAWTTQWDKAMGWARDIYWNMTEADIASWSTTSFFACGQPGCPSLPGNDLIKLEPDGSAYYKFGHFYAYRQFAHYIRPGYQRIGTSCGNCTTDPTIGQVVKSVAFRSPTGKIVVVVINDQSGSQAITLNGLPAGTYDITGVSVGNQQSPVTFSAQTIGAGQAVTLTFSAQAIVTFAQR